MESIILKIKDIVEKHPNKIAIQCNDKLMTYKELDIFSDYIAHNLLNFISRGQIIGVHIYKDEEFIPIIIALWKIGCAYVPLDKDVDYERINYIIKDAKINYVISDVLEKEINANIINKYEITKRTKIQELSRIYIKNDEICYIIYTSGTTGKPKGVIISNNNVSNFVDSIPNVIDFSSNDRILAITTENFDIAFLELFLPLCLGATVIIGNKRHLIDMQYLSQTINDKNITIMQATPTTWEMLFNTNWNNESKIKILCGGEPLTQSLAKRILKSGSKAWNLYGPTETTIWSSTWEITNMNISIGKPINNTRFYITNSDGEKIEKDNIEGELCIAGKGVSRGYINNPELTKDKFIFLENELAYKTGDIVFKNNNLFYYKGRKDFQVKINGHRIEIEDIENNLISINEIEKAIVVYDSRVKQLKAYVKTREQINEIKIIESLRNKIPAYMIPKKYYFVNEFPLTFNKKVNRKKLLEL